MRFGALIWYRDTYRVNVSFITVQFRACNFAAGHILSLRLDCIDRFVRIRPCSINSVMQKPSPSVFTVKKLLIKYYGNLSLYWNFYLRVFAVIPRRTSAAARHEVNMKTRCYSLFLSLLSYRLLSLCLSHSLFLSLSLSFSRTLSLCQEQATSPRVINVRNLWQVTRDTVLHGGSRAFLLFISPLQLLTLTSYHILFIIQTLGFFSRLLLCVNWRILRDLLPFTLRKLPAYWSWGGFVSSS